MKERTRQYLIAALLTLLAVGLFMAAESLLARVPKCERCGATLVPFQDDDRFYVCEECGFMVDMERASEW